METKVKYANNRLIALGVLEVVPDDTATAWCTKPIVAPKPHKLGEIHSVSNMSVPNVTIKGLLKEAMTVEDVICLVYSTRMKHITKLN